MAQFPGYATGQTVYVVDGSRTPFLKARGRRGAFSAADLALAAARPLLARQNFPLSAVDEVIFGCVMPGPDEANIARIISLRLGLGERVPAWTVQRNCASGLQALDCAAQSIALGRANLVLAGGVEAMSHAPILLTPKMVDWLADWNGARDLATRIKLMGKLRPAHFKPVIALLRGLTDPVVGLSMGQTAENLAARFNISREQMDAYAVESHQRLARAQHEGRIGGLEVLYDRNGNYYFADDGLRRDSTVEQLAKLKPVFDKPFGLVTAGNSAQVTDGAACLLLASDAAVAQYQLPVLGRLVDCAWAGLDPAQMGLGPVYAMAPLLARHGLRSADIDYWEINEAFAAQVLACLAAWDDAKFCGDELRLDAPLGTIDSAHLNVDGGGVSLGHPVGASGARIVLQLLHVLKRNNAQRGVASLCIGGGQGGAILVERV